MDNGGLGWDPWLGAGVNWSELAVLAGIGGAACAALAGLVLRRRS